MKYDTIQISLYANQNIIIKKHKSAMAEYIFLTNENVIYPVKNAAKYVTDLISTVSKTGLRERKVLFENNLLIIKFFLQNDKQCCNIRKVYLYELRMNLLMRE